MSGAPAGAARLPLPPEGTRPREGAGASCAGLVAAFLERTRALPCGEAARMACVHPDTIRRWRRRLPRGLRASIARRLAEITAEVPSGPSPADGLRMAFRRVLRQSPGEG